MTDCPRLRQVASSSPECATQSIKILCTSAFSKKNANSKKYFYLCHVFWFKNIQNSQLKKIFD